jgi:hypothetical protein
MYFVDTDWRYTLLVLLISLAPYNLYLHNDVIKDVATQAFLLLFVALVCTIKKRETAPGSGLTVSLILVLFAITLTRYNSISILPALAAALLWAFGDRRLRASSVRKQLLRWGAAIAIIAVATGGVTRAIEETLNPGGFADVRSFTVGHLFRMDLLGMSIRSGHEGITAPLDDDARAQLEKVYFTDQIFFNRQLDPAASILPDEEATRGRWREAVLTSPGTYLAHRWCTYWKLFNGKGQKYTRYIRMDSGWPYFKELEPEYAARWGPPPHMARNAIYTSWKRWVESYFRLFSNHVWLPILNLAAILVLSISLASRRKLNEAGAIAFLMNTTAFLYYAPYIVLVHHPEVRYVYPSNSMILFSAPFLIKWFMDTRRTKLGRHL